jgi:glucose/arabinose dehydrogenase
MISLRFFRAVACAIPLTLFAAGAAPAAEPQGPPPPTAANGNPVETLAQGVPTPTQFAFGAGTVFVAAAGAEDGSAQGGIYVVRDGAATRVPGSPPLAFGVIWRKGTLYVTSGPRLLAMSGWNGTRFTSTKTLFKGPKGMPALTGLAIGPFGRIYTGVSFNAGKFDAQRSDEPLAQRLISLKRDGSDLRVETLGLRQPWMIAFAKGDKHPFVSVLAGDSEKVAPPDWIVKARHGQDYGFAECTWKVPADCAGFPAPFARFKTPHASPMGLAVIGRKLYVALFGGVGKSGPAIVSINRVKPNKIHAVLTGYVAPVVALGTHGGWLYTGDLTGAIYRVKA